MDMVWREGMDQWSPASAVTGLFTKPTQPVPPPLPSAAASGTKASETAVADKLRQVGQKAKDFAQSEQVQEAVGKAKSKWQSLSLRSKAITVGVGLLALVVVWSFLFGGGTPYEGLVERTQKLVEKERTLLLKEHDVEDIKMVPRQAFEAASERMEDAINATAAKYTPLPITLDSSCETLISDVESGPPVKGTTIFGGWKIPLTFTAQSRIPEFNSGLVCNVYDEDGTICEKADVYTKTEGAPGDGIQAEIVLSDSELAKACKLRIVQGGR